MLGSIESKRITYKRIRPNPLFEEWLEGLHLEARTKKSKLEPMLEEALQSLSKYPLRLETGAECAILRGFDKRLCLFLDKQLEVHESRNTAHQTSSSSASNNIQHFTSQCNSESNKCKSPVKKTSNNIDSLKSSSSSSFNSNIPNLAIQNSSDSESNKSNSPIKKTGRRQYKPSFRSGAYAILLSLLEHSITNPNNQAINKDTLIDKAEKYSEESFNHHKPESYYTPWSNMGKLITKGLVKKSRNKEIVYCLTEEGKILSKALWEESQDKPTSNDIIFNKIAVCKQNNNESFEAPETVINVEELPVLKEVGHSCLDQLIELNAGSFEIILLIDKNEISGVSKKNDPTVAQFNKYPSLKHEYRSLKVGDFTWIARHKVDTKKELILPFIVERKRMDDLGASIKDGRFHEQKFRLRKCGLRHIIYMIENYGSNKYVGLPFNSLMQALANTRVQDGFKVHVTDSLANSARFLAMMSRRLTIAYENKDLKGTNKDPEGDELMSFEYFNKSSAKTKTLTITEMFIKLLLQLKGMSVEKALAITSLYNTPKSLIKVYEKCNKKEGEMLLANLKYGGGSRNVGPSVSKSIYQFFSNKDLI